MDNRDIEDKIRELGESLRYESDTDFTARGLAEMAKIKEAKQQESVKRRRLVRSLAATLALFMLVAIPVVVNSYINKKDTGYSDGGIPSEVIGDIGFKNLDEYNYIQGKSYKGFPSAGFDIDELTVFRNVEDNRAVYLHQHTSLVTDFEFIDNILCLVLYPGYKNSEMKLCTEKCKNTMVFGDIEVRFWQEAEPLEAGLILYHSYAVWTNYDIEYYLWQDALSPDVFMEQLAKLFI